VGSSAMKATNLTTTSPRPTRSSTPPPWGPPSVRQHAPADKIYSVPGPHSGASRAKIPKWRSGCRCDGPEGPGTDPPSGLRTGCRDRTRRSAGSSDLLEQPRRKARRDGREPWPFGPGHANYPGELRRVITPIRYPEHAPYPFHVPTVMMVGQVLYLLRRALCARPAAEPAGRAIVPRKPAGWPTRALRDHPAGPDRHQLFVYRESRRPDGPPFPTCWNPCTTIEWGSCGSKFVSHFPPPMT